MQNHTTSTGKYTVFIALFTYFEFVDSSVIFFVMMNGGPSNYCNYTCYECLLLFYLYLYPPPIAPVCCSTLELCSHSQQQVTTLQRPHVPRTEEELDRRHHWITVILPQFLQSS